MKPGVSVVESKQPQSSGSDSSENAYVFPVTFAQQRLWFLDQLQPGGASYNVPWSIQISGILNAEALERCLNEIVRRHEVLRTTFSVIDGEPVQVVVPSLTIGLPVMDLAVDTEPERRAKQEAIKEAQQPLDLKNGPLVRARLLRLGPESHILLLTLHHINFDGWSRRILVRELATLYEAFSTGHASPLPDLPLQYADYAVWQRKHLQGKNLQRQLDYWKHQLDGAPTSLDLPTDRPRPAVQTYSGAAQAVSLPATLTERLTSLARQEGATLYMALLAGFETLLARYSGQNDILVGTPIANRNRAEIEGLIGFFANTLVLRGKLSDDLTFRGLLARVKEDALGAYAHQDLPFEKLVQEIRPERSLSQNPLFQIMFSLQNAPRQAFELPGLELKLLESSSSTAKFDLSLFLVETPEGLRGRLEYNTDLFDATTIERLLGHYQVLLEAVAANPELRVAEVPLLTPGESRQLLVDWNATALDYPRQLCLHHLFEQQVERTPDSVACQFEAQTLTYHQLNERANQLACWLRKRGVGPGQRVGLFLERSLDMMVGLLGIQKSGAAYVPLDPAYPAERIRLTLDDAQVPVLITQDSLRDSLPKHQAQLLCLDSGWSEIARESSANRPGLANPADLVYVIFTSGSTGRPKGVQVPHRAVVNLLTFMAKELRMGPNDVFPALASFAFDMCIPELYLALVSGGRVVLGHRNLAANGEELADLLRKTGATIVHATPTTWNLLLAAGFSGKGLKRVIGAEPVPRDLCTRLLEADASLYNFYGPTETTVWSTFHHFRSQEEPVVVGRPLANTQVYILDANLQPVPIGIPGEIHIAGEGVTCGYLNRPDLTAEKFIADPFIKTPGAKMYKTGDLGRFLADGRIEFLGRSDHQVKVRGYRIELGEIEAVLGEHPAVRECAVIAREDVAGDQRLVGYVVAPEAPSPSDLRAWVQARLPDYMVPVAFVPLAKLPLTPNGKVDRKNLPAPDYARPELTQEHHRARTPAEEVIAGIWAEVLKIDQIGWRDDFFELGGHSLLATQVVSRIRQTFQVELPLRALFEAPTIAGLAARAEALQREQHGLQTLPLQPVSREHPLPLSFAQQRLWFLDQLEPNNPLYNVPYITRLRGPINVDAIEKSLQEIVRRHESLRTTFQTINDEPLQVIAPALDIPLNIIDLTTLPKSKSADEARRLAMVEVQHPFNLKIGPLLRATLFKLSEADHVLILNTHHIISDRWSLNLLSQELAALYEARVAGRTTPLSDLAIQYADYAVWQRSFLAGSTLDHQLGYWKHKLGGAPASIELPTDRPRPPEQTFHGAKHTISIPRELVEQLKALSRKEGVTFFMTLLSAFTVLLSRYSAQDDIVVGSPIAGRTNAAVEKLIGFFVNTLLLRTDLSGNPTFRELLERVRETAMGAYAHQDLPFEKLVEELKPDRDLSRNPLFQVMLILQNVPTSSQKMASVQTEPFLIPAENAKFDLTLIAAENTEGLRATFEFNTDLFDASTIERMADHFQNLLSAVVADSALRVADVPLLTLAEQHQLLVDWNETEAAFPQKCLHDLIAAQAQITPERNAVLFGLQRISYAELDARSNQFARFLSRSGIGSETLVGLCLERSPDMLVALLGVLKAGGAYVPLDPSYPEERIQFILDDAQAPVLITDQSSLSNLTGVATSKILLDAAWPQVDRESAAPLSIVTKPESLAYVLYTSGSTGNPKGVQIEHRSLVNFLVSMIKQPGLTAADRLLAVTTLSFDIAGLELFLPLITGAQIVLASREQAADGNKLLALMCESGASVLQATPATWRMLLDSGWIGSPQLKALCGGEAMPSDLAEQIVPRCAELWNMYGPTETTIWSSLFKVESRLSGAAPIGRPIDNTTMYVLDSQLQPVPLGVVGELYIGGAGVARGYFKRPELTTEKFLADPFRPGQRIYRTGDLARFLPDGNLQFLGRADFQVKVRGFRIELGEIESALAGVAAVQQSAVVVREDRPGDARLVAYVVFRPGQAATTSSDIRAHLRRALPDYMLPTSFVTLAALPLTPNGKIDRKALPKPEISRDPNTSTAPQDDFEHMVLRVWQRVLGTENIGVLDNFFEIGGHSLLAVRMLSELKRTTNQEIPLAELFRGSTIEHLAKLLRAGTAPVSHLTLTEIQPNGSAPAFFAVVSPGVNSLGYLTLSRILGPEQPFYKLQGPGQKVLHRPYTKQEYERMALDYVRIMRAQQPVGPYLLGGMCQGAHIAFEMTRVLESQGQTVELLAIFDTWVVENNQNRALWYLYYYRQRLRKFWNYSTRKKLAGAKRLLRKKAKQVGTGTNNSNVWRASYWPGKAFVPEQVNTPITVFKIPQQPFYYVRDPFLGWASRTTKTVTIEHIEAKHLLMLRKPWVRNLGQALSRHLRLAHEGITSQTPSPAVRADIAEEPTTLESRGSSTIAPGNNTRTAAATAASKSHSFGTQLKPPIS